MALVKKKVLFTVGLAASMLLACSLSATAGTDPSSMVPEAQPAGGTPVLHYQWYLQLGSGLAIPFGAFSGKGSGLGPDADTGWSVDVTGGYRLSRMPVRFELAYTYSRNSIEGLDAHYGTHWLMANALLDINRFGVWVPYLGVGVGAARISTSVPSLPMGTANHWAYQGILGVDYRINDQLRIGLSEHVMATSGNEHARVRFLGILGMGLTYYFEQQN